MEGGDPKFRKKYLIVNFTQDNSFVAINWKTSYYSGALTFGPTGSNDVTVLFGKTSYVGTIVGTTGMEIILCCIYIVLAKNAEFWLIILAETGREKE